MEGSPEDLARMIRNSPLQSVVQQVSTTLDSEDNEQVVQVLLSTFRHFITLGGDLCQTINLGLLPMGYMLHERQIPRDELSTIVYYSRITTDMVMLRSQFHPLHLMTLMPEDKIPESFKLLFTDSNYLPNIISVWDKGNPDSVNLLTFQKVNVHYNGNAPAPTPTPTPTPTVNIDDLD
jgi:hypothetical protein